MQILLKSKKKLYGGFQLSLLVQRPRGAGLESGLLFSAQRLAAEIVGVLLALAQGELGKAQALLQLRQHLGGRRQAGISDLGLLCLQGLTVCSAALPV